MIMKIVVMMVVAVVGPAAAWPIVPPFLNTTGEITTDTREVFMGSCGETGDINILPSETLKIVLNSTDPNEDCQILLRVSIKDDHLAKYGLQVSGHVQFEDDDCSASSLLLEDSDDETDANVISETFCSSGPISYTTVEDVVIFSFVQRGRGEGAVAGWEGASVTVTPQLVCGGIVAQDATLTIPSYSFQAPYVCNWRLTPGVGQKTRVTFQEFDLTPPKKDKCKSDCLYFVPGDMTHYCGTQLLDSTKELPGQNLMSLRVNSATTQFSCTVEYINE